MDIVDMKKKFEAKLSCINPECKIENHVGAATIEEIVSMAVALDTQIDMRVQMDLAMNPAAQAMSQQERYTLMNNATLASYLAIVLLARHRAAEIFPGVDLAAIADEANAAWDAWDKAHPEEQAQAEA